MTIYWASDYPALTAAIQAIPNYQSQSDQQITDLLNAQTEPDDGPVDAGAIRTAALENRFTRVAGANSRSVWGALQVMAARAWSEGTQAADHAKNDVICAASSFLSIFRELEAAGTPLVRGSALWNTMDVDLQILTNTTAAGASMNLPATSGAPIMTVAQANWVRAQGDRTRPKWVPLLSPDVIGAHRA